MPEVLIPNKGPLFITFPFDEEMFMIPPKELLRIIKDYTLPHLRTF